MYKFLIFTKSLCILIGNHVLIKNNNNDNYASISVLCFTRFDGELASTLKTINQLHFAEQDFAF